MKSIDNLGIRKRLMIIFVTCMTIFICFGIFAIREMNNLGNVTRGIYEHPLQVSNAAIEARVDITKIQRDTKDLILSKNEAEIKNEIEKITTIEQQVLYNLNIIRTQAIVEQSLELEKEARELFMKWDESCHSIINFVLKGNIEQATLITRGNNTYYVDKLEQLLQQIDSNARKKANELIKEAENIEASQKTTLITIITITSIIFLVLFILIISSILAPIITLKNAMDTSTNTGILSEVSLKGKNEIVDMSKYYNILVKKLRDLFWIKDGQNMLSQELSGYITPEELAQKAINFLARYVDAGKGVFYIYDKENNLLRLKSAFAFTEKDKLSEQLCVGEGIIGQVALESKPILLKNISKHENIIATGIVSEAPLNTYTFPVTCENGLCGVIELASFEPFTQLKLDFLNEISRIISLSLYSVIQNQKVKDLLYISEESRKEARKAAEDLKNANAILQEHQELLQQQTEELLQTNTELEEQQQLLHLQSEELQQTNIQLEQQQQQLEEQSSLLSTQNKNLEESRKELELINKYKSEFLANMSHELRTPLNSIILLSKLLLNRNKSGLNEDNLEKVNIINKSGQELLRLINDILDLSKIEAGRMSLDIFSFHSKKLIEELKQLFEDVATEKHLTLITEDLINNRLIGDQYKISQILRNLVSNAIKFTEKGSIIFKIMPDAEKENGIVFLVKDTGIGISKEKQSMIFEEFQQGDGSVSRKYGGTGLGLSISKKLANLMGGKIRIKSEVGIGSEFSLCLPNLIVPYSSESNIVQSFSNIKHDIEEVETVDIDSSPTPHKAILIIEDDVNFAQYIKSIIENMGFKPLLAASGRNGLQFARKYRPNGILLDLNLPDISGIDVLRELKSTIELRNIPVHIISVWNKDNKTQKMGAIGYNQKPVEENEIIKLITDMIAFSEKTPKQLLLIEDNVVQQEAIKELIGNKDILIQMVDTEQTAMFEISKGIYDAVILDLELKEGNGMNVCKFIGNKKIEIPVIVYTGKDLTIEQENEIRRYADSIIIKTATSEQRLLDEVTLFLHKVRENQKELYYLFSRTKEECALSLETKNILIVDDDPRNVFVLASALEDYGAKIIEANNGKVALQKLSTEKIDLILMDIMMPEMDGYETIRTIRENEDLKHIPIIALTAKSLKGDREKCISVGANDYISKPVDYNVLIRLVKAWINK